MQQMWVLCIGSSAFKPRSAAVSELTVVPGLILSLFCRACGPRCSMLCLHGRSEMCVLSRFVFEVISTYLILSRKVADPALRRGNVNNPPPTPPMK